MSEVPKVYQTLMYACKDSGALGGHALAAVYPRRYQICLRCARGGLGMP
jgi:hypothetical protein